MRILHVIASIAPRYGGPSRTVVGLAEATHALGHDVRIVTTNRDGDTRTPPEHHLRTGAPPVVWARAQAPQSWGFSVGLVPMLRREIRHADIVHVHSLYLFHTFAATRLANHFGIPYVLRPHGALTSYHRRHHRHRKALYHRLVEDRTLAHAAFVHCTSQQELDDLRAAGVGTPAEVVSLGLNVQPTPTPLARGPISLAYVGRLTEKKRPWLAVETVAELARRGAPVHLTVAGPEEDLTFSDLRRLAERLGVNDLVDVIGPVGRDGLARLLTRSTMLIHPSREENFGLAVAEAMAMGRPAVVTSGVALAELIVGAAAGALADADAASLADAVQTVEADPTMGHRAHQLAQAKFAWPVIARQMEAAYGRVLAGTGRAALVGEPADD